MSREWNEHKFCSAENLWCWIDKQAQKVEREMEVAKEAASESYKLLLMGRKEMLDWLGDWLHENETTLGEVAKRWGFEGKE